MLSFINKEDVFAYIKNKFGKDSKVILIRGSTATKPVKNFSDFDIEIYGDTPRKPYYAFAFIKDKLVLISVYFYEYKKGKKKQKPSNTKILSGEYNVKIKPDFSEDTYTNKEKIKRECQLVVDFFFKYLRSGDKEYLKAIQKRIKD